MPKKKKAKKKIKNKIKIKKILKLKLVKKFKKRKPHLLAQTRNQKLRKLKNNLQKKNYII